MEQIKSDIIVDAKELACPMPIVRTKKAMDTAEVGNVLEVQATDPGSEADIKAWAESGNHQYLGTIKAAGVLKHYLRKATLAEKEVKMHSPIINNEELEEKMKENKNIIVVDLREAAEYAFNHIPNTKNIPLDELENHLSEFDKNEKIYLLCQTGNRSDLAAQKLTNFGFQYVYNVVPGISGWSGKTEGIK